MKVVTKRKTPKPWESYEWLALDAKLDELRWTVSPETWLARLVEGVMQHTSSWPRAQLDLYLSVLQFKQSMHRRALELMPRVWSNFEKLRPRLQWTLASPPKVLAALMTCGKQDAIGGSVLRMCEHYVLLTSPQLMEHPPEEQDQVLLHELVHMGYRGHGAGFRAHCHAVGGVLTGDSLGQEPGIFLEFKPEGAHRYKRLARKFASQAEAEAFVRQVRASSEYVGGRFRLLFI